MIVELFAASGGLAEGFRRAGLPIDLAVERDPEACDSYAANLGVRPWQADVRALLDWTPPEPIDLLIADPPCAMWSRAGKRRGLADERDGLAVTVEIIRRLRPRSYLVGNIPGLDDRPHWPVVQRLLGGLAADGYCVRDFASLNAADYGVPQVRVRPFWYGHLDGPCIRWPEPTHADPALLARALPLPGVAPQLAPWVSVREVLQAHLGDDPTAWGRPVSMQMRPTKRGLGRHGSDETRCSAPDATARVVVAHQTANGGQILLNVAHSPSSPDRPSKGISARMRSQGGQMLTLHDTPQSARALAGDRPATTFDARPARAGTGNATLAWPWERPATTVTVGNATGRLAAPGNGSIAERKTDPNAIVLSERAALVLQGFPPGWTICGRTAKARWSQIGQAVPPAVAEAIARAIRAARGWYAHPHAALRP